MPIFFRFAACLSPARFAGGISGVVAALMLAATGAAAGQFQLLMFERDGCSYCLLWNEQIGPAYPRTAQGRAAPLERLDVKAPLPEGVTLTGRPPAFTPTFVLLDDGTEVGRIEGYAGDEFFWVLLDRMLDRAGWTETDQPAGPAPTGPVPAAAGP